MYGTAVVVVLVWCNCLGLPFLNVHTLIRSKVWMCACINVPLWSYVRTGVWVCTYMVN